MMLYSAAIIGAGPAGCAAAISLARVGLKVLLLEASSFPRHRPGESLHPGVEPIFEKLGVAKTVNAAGFLRYPGHRILWDSREPERLERFGKDDCGEWLGYQAWRPELDRILLEKAESHGAAVWQPCRAHDAILEDGRLTTIETERGSVQARYFLDASGRSECLSRKLGIPSTRRSPRLCARFGYVACAAEPGPFDIPRIRRDADGWTWIARVRKDRCTWTRMRFDGIDPGPDWMPPELSGFHPAGSSSGADVTWRISDRPAGPGWFLLGDAAAVLDPASSHGVLRALMSGMQAASLIAACERAEIADSRAARLYTQWLRDWFDSDVSRLRKLYPNERTGLDFPIEQGLIGLPPRFDSRKNSTGETNHGAHQ